MFFEDCGHLLETVTQVTHNGTTGAVDVLLPLIVIKIDSFSPDDRRVVAVHKYP